MNLTHTNLRLKFVGEANFKSQRLATAITVVRNIELLAMQAPGLGSSFHRQTRKQPPKLEEIAPKPRRKSTRHTPPVSPAEQDREEDFSTEVHEEDFTARNPILKPTKLSDCILSLRGQLVGTASKEEILNLQFPKTTDTDPENTLLK